jgi:hypothetical protein|tara:strand:+ start:360 stop:557 length:198 start_codon:yes stop_codon:yes gene_type:complete
MLIKPNKDEKMIIAILIATSFGLIIGVWAMQEKVNEAESERDLMMYHAEEMLDIIKKQDTIPDDE